MWPRPARSPSPRSLQEPDRDRFWTGTAHWDHARSTARRPDPVSPRPPPGDPGMTQPFDPATAAQPESPGGVRLQSVPAPGGLQAHPDNTLRIKSGQSELARSEPGQSEPGQPITDPDCPAGTDEALAGTDEGLAAPDGDPFAADPEADWGWVEEWRATAEPVPWGPGLTISGFTLILV